MRTAMVVVAIALATFVSEAWATTTVTLLASQDSCVSKDDGGQVGLYGFMNADIGGLGTERRILMQWDLSGIPSNAVILSAQANVYRYSSNDDTTGSPFKVYRLTQSWVEGWGAANGLPVSGHTAAGVTWGYRDCSDPLSAWTNPGGDFDEASQIHFSGATVFDPVNGANFGMQPVITDIVQSWVNGTNPNYGILIMTDEGVFHRHAMRAREYGISVGNGSNTGPCPDGIPGVFAPQLVITYTPEPATLSLLALGGLAALSRRRR